MSTAALKEADLHKFGLGDEFKRLVNNEHLTREEKKKLKNLRLLRDVVKGIVNPTPRLLNNILEVLPPVDLTDNMATHTPGWLSVKLEDHYWRYASLFVPATSTADPMSETDKKIALFWQRPGNPINQFRRPPRTIFEMPIIWDLDPEGLPIMMIESFDALFTLYYHMAAHRRLIDIRYVFFFQDPTNSDNTHTTPIPQNTNIVDELFIIVEAGLLLLGQYMDGTISGNRFFSPDENDLYLHAEERRMHVVRVISYLTFEHYKELWDENQLRIGFVKHEMMVALGTPQGHWWQDPDVKQLLEFPSVAAADISNLDRHFEPGPDEL